VEDSVLASANGGIPWYDTDVVTEGSKQMEEEIEKRIVLYYRRRCVPMVSRLHTKKIEQ
jgi:hypothetical protein